MSKGGERGMTFQGRPRTWGCRFSRLDGFAIAICIALTVIGWQWVGAFALAAPLVLGHFFLFCNVFRIRRSYELIWAGVFVINFSAMLFRAAESGTFPMGMLLLVQLPVTAILIGLEIRSPRYHGLCSRRWNKSLDKYLSGEID